MLSMRMTMASFPREEVGSEFADVDVNRDRMLDFSECLKRVSRAMGRGDLAARASSKGDGGVADSAAPPGPWPSAESVDAN